MSEETSTPAAFEQKKSLQTKRQGIFIICLSIILIIVALGSTIVAWKADNAKQNDLSVLINDHAIMMQKLTAQESQLQQLQQAQNKTRFESEKVLSQVEYWVQLANAQLITNHDTEAALKILLLAQETLNNNQSDAFSALNQSIAYDIQALQSTTPIDVNAVFMKLNNINTSVQQLFIVPKNLPTLKSNIANNSANLPWYRDLLDKIKNMKELFVIEHLNQPIEAPLSNTRWVALKESFSMQINLAQWALLHRNETIYNTCLQNLLTMLNTDFSLAQSIAAIQNELESLQKTNIDATIPSLENTIKILSAPSVLPKQPVTPKDNKKSLSTQTSVET